MKKKKIHFETEYLLLAGKWRPFLMLLLLLAVIACNFLLAGVFWQIAVFTGPILCVAVLCFMDYFVFAGFNSRRSIGMDMLMSSVRGRSFIENVLKHDIVNKSLYVMTGSVAALVSIFMFNEDIDRPFVIFYAIGAFSTSQILMRLTLLLDRAKGLTMQTHVLICYLCYSVGTLILLPLIFLSETGNLTIMIIYAVIAEALSILTGIWLVKSCVKAYESGFHDAVEDAKRADT